MDIGGIIQLLHEPSKGTISNHNRNISRLDELIEIFDEPKFNIKILYKEEKRISSLMSLYKTIMKYLRSIDIYKVKKTNVGYLSKIL